MENIIYLGDIHGQFGQIIGWIHHNKHRKNCYIIQVGDFGIGFRPKQEVHDLKILNGKLKQYNHQLLVIRGNHDDPSFFSGNNDYDNIKFLPDYTVLNLNNTNHLFVGGALSIDRKLRIEGKSYWKNEGFQLDEFKLKEIKNIDVLVTHTCMSFNKPTFFSNIVYSFAAEDPDLISELDQERKLVDMMWDILNTNQNNIKFHFYGHFHYHDTEFINDTKHVLLNVDEFYEEYN